MLESVMKIMKKCGSGVYQSSKDLTNYSYLSCIIILLRIKPMHPVKKHEELKESCNVSNQSEGIQSKFKGKLFPQNQFKNKGSKKPRDSSTEVASVENSLQKSEKIEQVMSDIEQPIQEQPLPKVEEKVEEKAEETTISQKLRNIRKALSKKIRKSKNNKLKRKPKDYFHQSSHKNLDHQAINKKYELSLDREEKASIKYFKMKEEQIKVYEKFNEELGDREIFQDQYLKIIYENRWKHALEAFEEKPKMLYYFLQKRVEGLQQLHHYLEGINTNRDKILKELKAQEQKILKKFGKYCSKNPNPYPLGEKIAEVENLKVQVLILNKKIKQKKKQLEKAEEKKQDGSGESFKDRYIAEWEICHQQRELRRKEYPNITREMDEEEAELRKKCREKIEFDLKVMESRQARAQEYEAIYKKSGNMQDPYPPETKKKEAQNRIQEMEKELQKLQAHERAIDRKFNLQFDIQIHLQEDLKEIPNLQELMIQVIQEEFCSA